MKKIILVIMALFNIVVFGKTLDLNLTLQNRFYLKGSNQKELYLLVELKGKKHKDNNRPGLNISMVIDKSGSMGYENKIKFVKLAAKTVVENLSEKDKISIIAYDTNVSTIQKSDYLKNKDDLLKKIDQIMANGTTNLSGGMLEGFGQVKNTYEKNYVNRVLLLSDGLANVGITDKEELIKIVKEKFKNDNIALSSFGVGLDFNEDLMTNLSEHGRGNYYFIDKSENIPDIFKKELKGLLSVIAQNTTVEIEYPKDYLELDKSFAYEIDKTKVKNIYSYKFNDLYSEDKRVALIKFKIIKPIDKKLNFKGKLIYDNVLNSYKRINEHRTFELKLVEDELVYKNNEDKNVNKKIIYFKSNEKLGLAAKEVDKGNYENAKKLINENKVYLDSNKELIEEDEQLQKQLDSNIEYENEIKNISTKSDVDIKRMQKSQKNKIYNMKKSK